jgi:hypothetical protein
MHYALGFCADRSYSNFTIFVLISIRSYFETKCLGKLSETEKTSHQNNTESYKQELHISGLTTFMENVINECRSLVEKTERRNPPGRLRRKWDDNIKIDLSEMGCNGVYWIELGLDRNQWWNLVNTVVNFWVPYRMGEFFISWTTIGFLKRNLM